MSARKIGKEGLVDLVMLSDAVLGAVVYLRPLTHVVSHVSFNVCEKDREGRPGRSGDVIGRGLRCSCVSPPTRPRS